jgi:hypothetical protein
MRTTASYVEHSLKNDQASINISSIVLHELERIISMLFTYVLIHISITTQVALQKIK